MHGALHSLPTTLAEEVIFSVASVCPSVLKRQYIVVVGRFALKLGCNSVRTPKKQKRV